MCVGVLPLIVWPSFLMSESGVAVEPVRLALGDASMAPEGGTAVITSTGHVRGEEGLFPAISADRQRIAILHFDDPHDRSFSLVVLSVETSDIERRMELLSASDRDLLWRSGSTETKAGEVASKVYGQIEHANQYLLEQQFRSIPSLFDMREDFNPGPLFRSNGKQHQTWHKEVGNWAIHYDVVKGTLEVSDANGSNTHVRITPPIEVYGIARPGVLCKTRPVPYQAWHDEESGALIVRLGYFWGGHGCDTSDKWLIERLEAA